MARATIATLNLFKKNGWRKIRADLVEAWEHADAFGFQERTSGSARRAVRRFRRRPNVKVWTKRSLGIVWDRREFDALPGRGKRKTHGGVRRFTPARWVIWQPLRHKASGKRVLLVNTHAINGYWKSGKRRPKKRDDLAKRHFTILLRLLERFSREEWDLVVLVGDLNARPRNVEEWFYPGAMLAGVVVLDETNALDWVVPLRASEATSVRRWTRRVNSDHRLHLHTLDF